MIKIEKDATSKGPDSWDRQRPLGRPAGIMLKFTNQISNAENFFAPFFTLKPKGFWSTIGKYIPYSIYFSGNLCGVSLYFMKEVLMSKECNYSKNLKF